MAVSKSRRILISDEISSRGLEILEQGGFEVDYRPGVSPAELKEAVGNCVGLVVRSRVKVTAELIEAGQILRVIGRAGAGVDNIDVEAATRRGIAVLNAPGANAIAVAEMTLAFMIMLARKLLQAQQSLRDGQWQREAFRGWELRGKTLGIIGLGRIGSEVAKRALAFGMTVVAHDPEKQRQGTSLPVRWVSLSELLEQSDVISLHVPLSSSTRHLIDAGALSRCKDGVYLINCARGGVVDEEALYDALVRGKVGGAALDVYESEPPSNSPLLQLPQVVATPHIGGATWEAYERVGTEIAQALCDFLQKGRTENLVNPEILTQNRDQGYGPNTHC